MAKPDTPIVDGHAFSWQRLCELRQQQLAAWKAVRPQQPALFELKDDCLPAAERTVAGRYTELILFVSVEEGPHRTLLDFLKDNMVVEWI